MCKETFTLPTVLARFEKTGVITNEQTSSIGTVGMTSRASGVNRDIRMSHPHDLYSSFSHQPIIKNHGDVYSRAQVRKEEIKQSIGYIRKLLENNPEENKSRNILSQPSPDSFAISLTEGWRGEICHCAVTDEKVSWHTIK